MKIWAHQDLNLGPAGYEPAALNRTELWAPASASRATTIVPIFAAELKQGLNRESAENSTGHRATAAHGPPRRSVITSCAAAAASSSLRAATAARRVSSIARP